MVVAIIALVVALSGTAVAAVDFARNAGAVDGKSAVGAKASLRSAAGKLVATSTGGERQGPDPGALPGRRHARRDSDALEVPASVDNQAGRPTPLLIIPGIGRFDAQCDDVDPTVGTQTTRTSINFTASVNQGVNVSRLLGRDIGAGERPSVFTAPQGPAGVDPGQRRRALRGHHGGQGAARCSSPARRGPTTAPGRRPPA
jgi:hypothetical protein